MHFLFEFILFNWEDDKRFLDENDLSEFDRLDEDFVMKDVIIGELEFEIDEQSFPILEHVWAKRANGLWLESYYSIKKTTINLLTKKNYFTGCDEDGWI